MDWLSPPPAKEPIDPALLVGPERPLAKGFGPHDILNWGILQAKELEKIDCRLYEVRRLNTLLADKEFTEVRPEHCEKPTADK